MSGKAEENDEARQFCQAGGQLFALVVAPNIAINIDSLDHTNRAQFLAGVLGGLLGYMSACVGPDDAEVVFRGFDNAFEEARQIRAQILKGMN